MLVEALAEQTELITQTVAREGDLLRGGGIHIAGGEAAEAAVAERRILDLLQTGKIDTLFRKKALHLVQNAEVIEVGIHEPADQILGGEIIGVAMFPAATLAVRPCFADVHHQDVCKAVMQFQRAGVFKGHVVPKLEVDGGLRNKFAAINSHKIAPVFLTCISGQARGTAADSLESTAGGELCFCRIIQRGP